MSANVIPFPHSILSQCEQAKTCALNRASYAKVNTNMAVIPHVLINTHNIIQVNALET